ncbi:hypothetical protein [Actinokineospora terrae]|uniref:MYXO-CTERM domain-containing protein n=1 Tax=Actinokineospora terrae TaxID=155974 RepID=A0A1H9KLQ8_9PSEU|nr:hypothetical protein [Actinokineospora terrae]SER00038.1 hypothetical protein SAMN04487818_101233 [Actinokineospora terrae]
MRVRGKALMSVLFVLVVLAAQKRSARPDDPPDPVASVVLGAFEVWQWGGRLLTR